MKLVARFFILMMLLVVFSPLSSNEVRASEHSSSPLTLFSYEGVANEVFVVGEHASM